MTTADKLEIGMLIQNINTMKAQSEKMDETYLNKEVIDYATKAFNNAKDVHKYICDVIQDNITLFFDFSKPIELSTHPCCGDYWVNLRDRHRLSVPLGSGIQVIVNVKPHLISNFEVGTYRASFKTTASAFDVVEVFTYVNDSDMKTMAKDYDMAREWDLFYTKGGLDSFYTNGKYNTKQRAAVWNHLYNKAKVTRYKTDMLVRFFKKLLNANCAYHKNQIDKKEKEFEQAKRIDKYENVTF
jgi:hypothetical protein